MTTLVSFAMLSGRIAVIELIWTVIGLVGLSVNYLNWQDARKDLRLLNILKKNGWMKRIAKSNIGSNRWRCITNIAVMTAGIVTMTQKPLKPASPVTVPGIIITAALFVVVIASIINPIQERRLRHDLMSESHHDTTKESAP